MATSSTSYTSPTTGLQFLRNYNSNLENGNNAHRLSSVDLSCIYRHIDTRSGKIRRDKLHRLTPEDQASHVVRLCDEGITKRIESRQAVEEKYKEEIQRPPTTKLISAKNLAQSINRLYHGRMASGSITSKSNLKSNHFSDVLVTETTTRTNEQLNNVTFATTMTTTTTTTVSGNDKTAKMQTTAQQSTLTSPYQPEPFTITRATTKIGFEDYNPSKDEHLWLFWRRRAHHHKVLRQKAQIASENANKVPPPKTRQRRCKPSTYVAPHPFGRKEVVGPSP